MGGWQWLWLGLQSVVFALWAFWMFRCLFRLRARVVAQTGSALPGPVASLRGFRDFMTLPEFTRDRRVLGLLTLVMFATIAGWAALVRGGGPV
ncbi:hypothetical protein [Szabonella alba]|uniref:Uncharacterized protein n=1 Tax=Szabonella alba TaxID=2804194 RepID=A0A8K0V8Q3_9RHOB|nr:hypothetical protein [Szabonella alba]MBL4915748.1 hypothetical protein [Szabonella alba]